MAYINYTKKYVAYLDVLGFKEIVFKNDKALLEEYFKSIKDTLSDIKNDKEKIESILISDSIILIAEDSISEFKLLLRAIQTIQIKLLQKNIWIRGAISFGDVFYDKDSNIVVGKALIDAYLLENEAKVPRVIIESSIITKIGSNKYDFLSELNGQVTAIEMNNEKKVHDFFKYTEEDCFFVSYSNRMFYQMLITNELEFNTIFEILKNNLYSNQKHYAKYLWVKKYFHETLHEIKTNVSFEPYFRSTVQTWIESIEKI